MNSDLTVVKLGGSLLDDAERRASVLAEIAEAWKGGEPIVLVHGGGKQIDAMLARLGIPKRTHAGLRVTDDATLQVVVAVLSGTVNKSLVTELSALGVCAAGIAGSDGGTLLAEKHPPVDGVDLGNVGRVVESDPTVIQALLGCGVMPVICSVAADADGNLLNVNADSAAAALAAGLKAKALRFITDVQGLFDATGEVISTVSADQIEPLIASGAVSGGMLPKLDATLHALRSGVRAINIGGGTEVVAA